MTREHQRRLELIVENTTNMVVVTDRERRIEWVNPAYTKVTGWTLDEVRGRNPRSFLHGPGTSQAEAAKIGERLRQGLPVHDVELLNYRKSGESYWVSLNIVPIRDEQGEVVEYVAIQSDITERKNRERLLHERALLDRAAAARMELLMRISHELRTPLHALLGFTDLVERAEGDRLQPGSRRGLGHIRTSAQHLLLLVNDVLDLGRLHEGRMALDLQPVSIHEVVEATLAMLGPVAAARGIGLAFGRCPSSLLARADRRRLIQVLLNLVANAIKYNCAGGKVTISCTAIDEGAVSIAVADTGIGIASEHLDRLFEPFYRVPGTQSEDPSGQDGTGLGLAIAQSLLQAMGGSIHVRSDPGAGSTFVVRLAREARASAAAGPAPAASAAAPAGGQGTRGTVLYIEDNEVNRLLVEGYLGARSGVALVCAADGGSGLAAARRLRPDLILIDLHLPDMNGYEVLRAVLDDEQLCRVPCVAFSAVNGVEDLEAAIQQGFREFLPKPSGVAAFLSMIDRILADRPGAQSH